MSRTCTLKGKTMTLAGPALTPGQQAPDAELSTNLVETIKISDTGGKTRIFSVVPSLDTPVCAEQTKRFNEAAVDLQGVDFYTISCDLPTGMARFCGSEGIDLERVKMLSDHRSCSFGNAYGTLVSDLRIECRAVFVVDAGGTIRYAEYVPEIADHPDYDAVIACAKACAS